jgi:hypothetical protein
MTSERGHGAFCVPGSRHAPARRDQARSASSATSDGACHREGALPAAGSGVPAAASCAPARPGVRNGGCGMRKRPAGRCIGHRTPLGGPRPPWLPGEIGTIPAGSANFGRAKPPWPRARRLQSGLRCSRAHARGLGCGGAGVRGAAIDPRALKTPAADGGLPAGRQGARRRRAVSGVGEASPLRLRPPERPGVAPPSRARPGVRGCGGAGMRHA